jgi:uncharacterized protein (TIGR00255 family)
MAISMTGFGRGEYKDEEVKIVVECKTINHKYLDVNTRMPREISFLEDKVRNLVKDYVAGVEAMCSSSTRALEVQI